jgi:hypothetical protein
MTTEELLDSWTSLMEDEWEVLRGRQLPKLILRDLGALMVGFVQWHTESRFKAFALLPALAR